MNEFTRPVSTGARPSRRPRLRRGLVAATVAGLVTGLAVAVVAPAAASAATNPGVSPVVERGPGGVTADALPTVQIDGVVWDQAVVGNTVYAGGQFANARPAGAAAGTNLTPRGNLLSYNITTGVLNAAFAPSLNAQVNVITPSPDGSRIYVGGSFTTANGFTRNRIVAYSTSTGAVLGSFAPTLDAPVNTIAATNSTVYVGGNFALANNQPRSHLAAFSAANGALLSWAPTADNNVQAMVLSPDNSRVIIGGSFANVNNSPAYGLASLDATTGTLYPFAANQVVRDAGTNASILSLSTDGKAVYSTAYVYGTTGNFEGVMSADPYSGQINWLADCHGDTYGAYANASAVYVVSHQHFCSNIGGFPDTNPRNRWYRSTAFTLNATGTVQTNSQPGGGYGNFAGYPSPSLINWVPNLTIGTVTGQNQAAWSVDGNSQYVVEGGEFPKVNNVAQQGLVRFAVPSLAPKKQGPRVSSAAMNTSVIALSSTTARVSWTSNSDRDDQNFNYTVLRNGVPVYQTQAASWDWLQPTMSFVDNGLTPGATYTYKVKVSDPDGNTATGDDTSVTMPIGLPGQSSGAYAQDVISSGATHFWRLDQAAGSQTSYDYAGADDLTVGSGIVGGAVGAIAGDSDTGSTFNGTTTGLAATKKAIAGPNTFTVSAWFKTSTAGGGKIVGFGNANTGQSSSYDRHLYLNSNSQVVFGVYPGSLQTITTAGAFNDGNYHMAVGELSPAGMSLYVDGKLIGTKPTVTTAEAYNGYWRIGGDSAWSGAQYFTGSIDDVAIYPTALTTTQIRKQYTDSGRVAPSNVAPTAAFSSSLTGATAGFDASGSSDSDGVVTAYAWDFGDGTTGTGVNPTHAYATSGNYDVKLTVTDDGGATNTVTHTITVTAPANQPPTANFTATPNYLTVAFDGTASSDPDGTVSGYQWNFGDGATSTGAAPSHTYTTANTYTVTLTVTDNRGGTNSVSHDVTVTQPPNQLPTADFTTSANGLTVGFDASTSSDPDGTITSYAWKFGDGGTATVAKPSHTYATPGTYPVTLTVTDDRGGQNVTTQQVTVSSTVAADNFGRTVSSGWGSADIGGAWTRFGPMADFAVAGNTGKMLLPAAGTQLSQTLNGVSARDVNELVDLSIDQTPTGNGFTSLLTARESGSQDYRLKVRFLVGGVMHLALSRVVAGKETQFSEVVVKDLTYTPGTVLRARFVVSSNGAGSTTLAGSLWPAGSTEPATAQITATDSTPELQVAGGVSLQSTTPANWTSGAVTAKYARYTVTGS